VTQFCSNLLLINQKLVRVILGIIRLLHAIS